MLFQKYENKQIKVIELPGIEHARKLAREVFDFNEKSAVFEETKLVKESRKFRVKNRKRKIIYEIKQI